jgi:hypothetical protein
MQPKRHVYTRQEMLQPKELLEKMIAFALPELLKYDDLLVNKNYERRFITIHRIRSSRWHGNNDIPPACAQCIATSDPIKVSVTDVADRTLSDVTARQFAIT